MVVDGQIYDLDLIRRRDIFNLIASVRIGSNGGRLSGETRWWGSPSSWWRHGRPAVELTLTLRRPNLDENRSYVIVPGWEAHLRGSQATGMTGARCVAGAPPLLKMTGVELTPMTSLPSFSAQRLRCGVLELHIESVVLGERSRSVATAEPWARVCIDFRMKLGHGAQLYKRASDKTVCNKA
jgi:hypothetical protein